MYLSEAIKSFFDYHRINSKKNTIRNYEMILTRFLKHFGDREIPSFNYEEILDFLNKITNSNEAPCSKLRGIKAEFRRSQTRLPSDELRRGRLAIHPCSTAESGISAAL